MKNSIAERVSDFLKRYPPFNLLDDDSLIKISCKVTILYLEKGDTLFKQNDTFHPYFYLIREGALSLDHVSNDKEKNIVGVSDAGDIFGIRPLINQENYKLTATANEESIVYGIPIEVFEAVTNNNVKVYKYLITAFASNTYDSYTEKVSQEIFVDYLPGKSQDIANFQTSNYTKTPITCNENTTLQEAALKMCDYKIGCIIVVNSDKCPVGIITNSDIKNNIATGKYPITTLVSNIMSSPIITEKKDITVANAQLVMIHHNIGHLCITKDGTPNTMLIGVLTHHDILVTLGNSPSIILKEIKRAKQNSDLRKIRLKANTLLKSYLNQNIPISHIVKIISKINDAVTVRAIELAINNMNMPPPVKFSWISIGSQGRKEQLLFTDQDNALIFEDVDEENYNKTQDYFLALAKLVTKSLNSVGFEYCEADMMARNKSWCKSISEWQEQFQYWIFNPNKESILLSCIFFDYAHIYGEKKLVDTLTDTIYSALKNSSMFFKFLGKDALKNPPPFGFFKQFLVEKNGDKKDLFNIKSKALMPLIDAARVLTLSKEVKDVNNTAERFEKLAQLEPNNKELFNSCSYAFKALLKFKTKQGLQNNNSGKFIELTTLTKEEKLKLKRCFKPINDIQESLILRFDLKNTI